MVFPKVRLRLSDLFPSRCSRSRQAKSSRQVSLRRRIWRFQYPAGIAVIADAGRDKLLIANNLSDNVVLLDPATGKILQTFDLSTSDLIPSSFPYTCVATRDGRRAWCSLWNASQVAELDLPGGKVTRWIKLKQPEDPLAPGSHPTAMLLSPDEKTLYVALSNIDQVAAVSTGDGNPFQFVSTAAAGQSFGGSYPDGSGPVP